MTACYIYSLMHLELATSLQRVKMSLMNMANKKYLSCKNLERGEGRKETQSRCRDVKVAGW